MSLENLPKSPLNRIASFVRPRSHEICKSPRKHRTETSDPNSGLASPSKLIPSDSAKDPTRHYLNILLTPDIPPDVPGDDDVRPYSLGGSARDKSGTFSAQSSQRSIGSDVDTQPDNESVQAQKDSGEVHEAEMTSPPQKQRNEGLVNLLPTQAPNALIRRNAVSARRASNIHTATIESRNLKDVFMEKFEVFKSKDSIGKLKMIAGYRDRPTILGGSKKVSWSGLPPTTQEQIQSAILDSVAMASESVDVLSAAGAASNALSVSFGVVGGVFAGVSGIVSHFQEVRNRRNIAYFNGALAVIQSVNTTDPTVKSNLDDMKTHLKASITKTEIRADDLRISKYCDGVAFAGAIASLAVGGLDFGGIALGTLLITRAFKYGNKFSNWINDLKRGHTEKAEASADWFKTKILELRTKLKADQNYKLDEFDVIFLQVLNRTGLIQADSPINSDSATAPVCAQLYAIGDADVERLLVG